MHIKAIALLLAALPTATSAEPAFVRYVPVKEAWFQRLYVQQGTSVDIGLLPGDAMTKEAIVGDPRWTMITFTGGANATPHIVLKPIGKIAQTQLVTIPAGRHVYHLLVQSGPAESTAYTIAFFEPPPRPGSVAEAPAPAPSATPRIVSVPACAPPLFTHYKITGDKRTGVDSVCDDGVRTYIIIRPSSVAAVPYRVDPAGHQDQILTPVYQPSIGNGQLGEWVFEGTFDHLALLADSSRGQIRTNIERQK